MSADGTWNTTINTPMGAQSGVLTLATDGGAVTGSMTAATGDSIELTDGTVDGDNLTWKAAMTSPMPMTLEFSATVSGDDISGNVKLGSFGDATFTGTRA